MCGIGFFINYDKTKKIPIDMIKETFTDLQYRGKDASGYYFEREVKGKMIRRLNKSGIPAEDLWKETQEKTVFETPEEKAHFRKYKIDGKERFIMLHARAKTQGHEMFNANNHPVFSDRSKGCEGYVLVHNGMVNGFNLSGYPYQGEVDSEEILANIEKFGIKEGLEKMNGSMSIIFKQFEENKIYLYRNTNPMDLVWFPEKQILVGASDKSYIDVPLKYTPLQKRLFQPGYIVQTLPINQLYTVSLLEKKITFMGEVNTRKWTYVNQNRGKGARSVLGDRGIFEDYCHGD